MATESGLADLTDGAPGGQPGSSVLVVGTDGVIEPGRRQSGGNPAPAGIIRYLKIAAMALPVAVYLFFVHHYGVNLIFSDEWDIVPIINAQLHGHLTLTMLWAQHNENRMLVPNLIFVLSGQFDHYDTHMIMMLGAAFYALGFLVFVRVYRSYSGKELSWLPTLVLGFVWLSFEDWENALWGFQLAWCLIALCLTLELWVLSKRRLTPALVALAAGVSLIASFSSIQGLILWPVGLLCLVWRLEDRKRLIRFGSAWTGAAAVCTAIYFKGLVLKPVNSNVGFLQYIVDHPRQFAEYLLADIGNVFPTVAPRYHTHEVLGVLVLMAASFVSYRSVRTRVLGDRIPLPASLIVFSLCFDVLTALGRVNLGISQGLSSRYTMGNLLLLVGISTYFIAGSRIEPGRHAKRSPLVPVVPFLLVIACLIGQCAVADTYGIKEARLDHQGRTTGAQALVNLAQGTPAELATFIPDYVFSDLPYVEQYSKVAKADGLSVFAPGIYRNYKRMGFP